MHKQELVEVRRSIHRHPELSFQEFHTSQLLQHSLLSKGLPVSAIVACASPGFYVDITGSAPAAPQSLCIALRAELDALAMQEENLDLPYRSEVAGVAHMCGHDVHSTILLGTGWALLSSTKSLPSNCKVRLIFQPSEEQSPSGAKAMVASGCLEGVDEIYAIHSGFLPLRHLICRDGTMMSVACFFTITISGKGGHGAYPHLSTDCVLSSALIIAELYAVLPAAISCFDSATLSVGQVHTGSAHNVLPDSAVLSGSIRTYRSENLQAIQEKITRIVSQIATAQSCVATATYISDCPPVINDPTCAQTLRSAMVTAFGPQSILHTDPIQASDDFSYFLERKPGAYAILGKGDVSLPHSSSFQVDEDMIGVGVQLWMSLISTRFGVSLG